MQAVQASGSGYRGWKDFRARDSTQFGILLAKGRAAVGSFHNYLRGSGLGLIAFGVGAFAGVLQREARLCRYARTVLARYDSEAMDSFHYAIMRHCGMQIAISSDRDWTNFPYGILFTAP
jgi:hypothetical protein